MDTNTNVEFLSLFNRLDKYLRRISGIESETSMIYYLEDVLPEKRASECETIRKFKNTIESHVVAPGGVRPDVPREWVNWLQDTLNYCKAHENEVAQKLRKAVEKKKSSKRFKQSDKSIKTQKITAAPVQRKKQTPAPAVVVNRKKPTPTLADYINGKAGTILKRLNGLDQEFVEKSIPNAAREGIRTSAESYLTSLRAAKTRDEAEKIFNKFQKTFQDLRKHPSVRKAQARSNQTRAVRQQNTSPASYRSGGASPSYSSQDNHLTFAIVLSIVLGLALIAGIVCLCVFASWTVWQYIIGVVGGLLLAGLVVLLLHLDNRFDWGGRRSHRSSLRSL